MPKGPITWTDDDMMVEIERLTEIADTNFEKWQEQTDRVATLLAENRRLAKRAFAAENALHKLRATDSTRQERSE